MSFKTFANNAILPASDLNTYLMRQVIIGVANDTERNALPVPTQGMTVFNFAAGEIQTYYEVYHATNNPQGRKTAGWYSNSWRKHAEFTTATASAANAGLSSMGVLTADGANTNDDNFAAYAGTAGRLRLKEIGTYAISFVGACTGPTTGRTFCLAQTVTGTQMLDFRDINVGENPYFIATIPALKVPSVNFDVDVQVYQTTGAARAVTGRLKVTKVA